MLGNPVPGHIQAKTETWDKRSFRVTQTFADHVADKRGLGIDFGNGRCGANVLAMFDGVVSLSGFLGAALVVRVRHSSLSAKFGGGDVVSGYAHLSTSVVNVGQLVKKGQTLGTLGKSGADACHLHAGFTVNDVERDYWQLLDQNAQNSDVTIIVNAALLLDANGKPTTRSVSFAPSTKFTGYALDGSSESFTSSGAGSAAPADALCTISRSDGKQPKSPPEFVRITAGVFADHPYLDASQPGLTLATAPQPPAGGFTQDDLDDAYNAGRSAVQGAAASVPPK